jgi:hypothetical protein
MEAVFDVKGKPFKVVCSYFGSEKYYYDNKLLLKRRTLKFADKLPFELDGSLVEIEVSISRKEIISRAYVDGQVVVSDLFPHFAERMKKHESKAKPNMLINFALWLVIAIVMMFVFQAFK